MAALVDGMVGLAKSEKLNPQSDHAKQVRRMFAGIAPRYDLLNHLLSINIDKRWRRRVRLLLVSILNDANSAVLDVACGTGDLSIELQSHANARVIGLDFCRPMLDLAQKKAAQAGVPVPFFEADALRLPFADESFDAVTIAFGLRNLASWGDGLGEFRRVLKPGGQLVVLEFSSPKVPGVRKLFNLYFSKILPRVGGVVSGSRDAYEYLPDSVSKFPDQDGLKRLMVDSGFTSVEYSNLTGGIAALHTGIKN